MREKILSEALKLFGRYGYAAVSLQAIADAVGLHKSSLFHHFRSKQALEKALTDQLGSILLKLAEKHLNPGAPSPADLRSFIEANADIYAKEPAWARYLAQQLVLCRDETKLSPEEIDHGMVRFLAHMGMWLHAAQEQGVVNHPNLPLALLQCITLMVAPLSMPDTANAFGLDEPALIQIWQQNTAQQICAMLGIQNDNPKTRPLI